MKKNYFFTLLITFCFSVLSFGQIVINEVDADQSGTDTSEFIELKWTPNTSLDGYVVVLFNGSDDKSYFAYDLDGKSTDANGLFILATTSLATASDIDMGADNKVQNGADAVAVYQANESDFPNDTEITLTGLVDVLVYGTSDSDDTGLLTGFGVTTQYDENLNGNKDTESIQRHTDGTYQVLAPSFRDVNVTSNTPTISITAPADNQALPPNTTETEIVINVANFTFSAANESGTSDGSGDGFLKRTLVSGGSTFNENAFNANNVSISVAAGESYTVTVELVDNSGASLSPEVKSSINFNVGSFTDVANLAALRAGSEGMYYRVTGEVIVSYTTSNRNQKYIQDASAAILIDDSADVLAPGNYMIGDGVTNLNGRLDDFNGVAQFIPVSNSGSKSSSGNMITPVSVTLAELNTNFEDYESEWVKIESATFDDADGTATFDSGTTKNYGITEGSNTAVVRLQFGSTNIEGTIIPQASSSITGIAAQFNSTIQIFPTELSGIVLGLSNENILGFATYPNPITNKIFTISSNSSEQKNITIFNVLGKKVFTTRFSGTKKDVDVSSINSGIYILKVIENGKIATKKLVIR